MSSITDNMKAAFLASYRVYELEREFNYLNYGKYPYRDRKNSIQIVADFNANAYSVNGVFVTESLYTEVYQPMVIESIEQVLISTDIVYNQLGLIIGDDGQVYGDVNPLLVQEYRQYETIVTREVVEREAVEIQTVSYVYPFDCVPDSLGRLVLSF